MNYEQKYKEALKRARNMHEQGMSAERLEYVFPELRESEDEKIRKEIIEFLIWLKEFRNGGYEPSGKYVIEDMTAWLEKQGEKTIPKNIDDAALQYVDTCAVDGRVTHDNINEPYWNNHSMMNAYKAGWLEKQDEQEQLYIRFGEIPTDEKSKIFQGEIEVGTENGVSVYPAFKTSEGDIVLGLSLPITKTTLYTQQHLIEYDNRPCYLVKGDYVGKDTDGQPLINNVSVIEKISTYRVKEEKQGEQKSSWSKDDEKMWVQVINEIEAIKSNSSTIFEKNIAQDKIDWLKSIKPKHWKPSEEQMEALNAINNVGELSYDGQADLLIRLYNDLEKL